MNSVLGIFCCGLSMVGLVLLAYLVWTEWQEDDRG